MTYQLASAELFVVKTSFRFRFRHAAAERSTNTTLFLRLNSADGCSGWGETLTRPYLTGETPESVVAAFGRWWADLKSLPFNDEQPSRILRMLWEKADAERANAAWALTDVACHDLWLKRRGRPAVTGGNQIEVTFPVGLGSAGLLPTIARMRGFRRIKFKSGPDLSVLNHAMIATGSGWQSIAIDGNGCFSAQDLPKLSALIRATGTSFIEQPFAPSDLVSAAALVREQVATVVADEAVCTLGDAATLIEHKAAQMFNIRLAKNGGVTGALALADAARQNGIRIQLGALVGESELLANAARFCLQLINPEIYEHSFPRVLLRRRLVCSDFPVFSPTVQGFDFSGVGFGFVDERLLRQRAAQVLQFA